MSSSEQSSVGPAVNQPPPSLPGARVLVAGDVMLDRYWFGEVHRISPEAPVPVVSVTRCEDRLGGAANVARNIAALGGRASLVGRVGDDDAARCLHALIHQAGIENHLQTDALQSTIVKLRVIGRHQQLLRVDFDTDTDADFKRDCGSEASAGLPAPQIATLLASHQAVIFSDYAKGTLANVSALISLARQQGKIILVDPKGEDFYKYAHAHILTPNQAEFRQIVGSWRDEDELIRKAQTLRHALSVDYLLLTRAEEGMTLYDGRHAQHFPAQAREVYDVSGAGDTVIATLATWWVSGHPLRDAVAAANRAAGLVVAKLGTAAVNRQEMFGDS